MCCKCYGCRDCWTTSLSSTARWVEINHGLVVSLASRPEWKILRVHTTTVGHVYYTPADQLPEQSPLYKVRLPIELERPLRGEERIYVDGSEVYIYDELPFATVVRLLPLPLEQLQAKYLPRLKATTTIEYHQARAEFIAGTGKIQPLDTSALRELVYSVEQLPEFGSDVDGVNYTTPNCRGQFGQFGRLTGPGFDLFIKRQDVSDAYHQLIYQREREMTQFVSDWTELREAKLVPELVYHNDERGVLVMRWIPNRGTLREVLESKNLTDHEKIVLIRDCFQLLALLHQRMMHLDAHIENFLIRPLDDCDESSKFRSTHGRPVLIDYSFAHTFDGTTRCNLNDVFTECPNLPTTDLPGLDFNYLAGGVILTLLIELGQSSTARRLYHLLIELTKENWQRVLPDRSVDDLMKLYERAHRDADDEAVVEEVIKVSNYFPDPFDRSIVQRYIPRLDGGEGCMTLDEVVQRIDDLINDD